MNTPDDPIVRRAAEELRKLPPVGDEAIRRVVHAAAAARLAPADDPVVATRKRGRSIRVWSAVGMTAAAAVVGFVARGVWSSKPGQPRIVATAAPVARPATESVARFAASSASDIAALPQQFVLESRGAKRVALVGDFNNWNPSVAPMARSSEGGLWSVIVPILPGRHMYGFMVDDSLFVLDPRAQKARDPDLGTEGSIRMVGRP